LTVGISCPKNSTDYAHTNEDSKSTPPFSSKIQLEQQR
jgi:hypothetical protein